MSTKQRMSTKHKLMAIGAWTLAILILVWITYLFFSIRPFQ